MQVFSHEIRNSLQVMKGLVDVLRLYCGDGHERAAKYLDSMEEQIHVLARFMDDVGKAYDQSAPTARADYSRIDLSPEGTTVSVSVSLSDCRNSARVRVEGRGRRSIFAGFYRPKDLSDWNNSGTGLGLYISRNIARQHGGDLWAENRPQRGTGMCLCLPLSSR